MIAGQKSPLIFFCLAFTLLFLISACISPTQDQGEFSTSVSPKVIDTQREATPPQDTETPTSAPTATRIPTHTSTPKPYLKVSTNTNCRTGPGTAYDILHTYQAGDEVLILGMIADGEFWFTSDQNDIIPDCWLWGEYATPAGDTSRVPIFTPPPTPTLRPDFRISYTDYDGSGADVWLWFKLENSGSTKWESVLVYTRNVDTGNVAVNKSNSFKDAVRDGSVIPNISVNKSGFISSGQLYKPFGYTIEVYVIACQTDDLIGLCQAKQLSVDLTMP